MIPKKFALLAALLVGATTLAACSSAPTDRQQVCQAYDTLGSDVMSANGLFDNPVFDQAGTLSDLAGRYVGTPSLGADASALHQIAKSNTTSVLALEQATDNIAELCDHPLGVGSTRYDALGNQPAVGNSDTTGNAGGASGGAGLATGGSADAAKGLAPATGSSASAGDSTGVTDEASAQAALQQEVDNDRAAVEQLVGSWVPQLSSKSYGLVADGIQYNYQAIWADFQTTKRTYPDALLLWSGDYSSFSQPNFWVTVVPSSFPGSGQANGWCDGQQLAPDACYAKLISHTAGPAGASQPR